MAKLMLGSCVTLVACAPAAPRPVEVRLGEDACAHCRMTIVSTKTAAQIVADGVEPLVFDDLACLRDRLTERPRAAGDTMFVADHRTGAWVDARQAVFTRTSAQTPMGSGLIAHADPASRDADPAALHGTPVTPGLILEPPARGGQS